VTILKKKEFKALYFGIRYKRMPIRYWVSGGYEHDNDNYRGFRAA